MLIYVDSIFLLLLNIANLSNRTCGKIPINQRSALYIYMRIRIAQLDPKTLNFPTYNLMLQNSKKLFGSWKNQTFFAVTLRSISGVQGWAK